MLTRGVILGTLAPLSIAIAVPLAAAEAQENPTTPGAIPNPGTYQGSMELQRQSDERDQQQREEQARQSQQQQQQYEQNQRQLQQRVSGNGSAAQQSSGPHRVPPRVPINFSAVTRASEAFVRWRRGATSSRNICSP
jgi:multidrug efflux pump subunit AcrA (membrane-fusion protein)